jgi:glycosyltransferase involved in cell wall biosynthesis
MSLKLVSHVNGDSDLIEAWLKYYLHLGVDHFHLVVHGDQDENSRLHAIQNSYPITIEDIYGGAFHIDEKKSRLNAVLARHIDQWMLLVDSDEFVEFPYQDIPQTIRQLEIAQANLMHAPMLQRLTGDGSLETPPVIDDPFGLFPHCSVDLYRRMGVKGDIFKFPLFFCASETRLAEGGNHHPPLGLEPRSASLRGVTHHFKFRRCVSQRLESRIHSEHPWRHESVQFRQYLDSHSNRLPLEGTFLYSREELFRRRLLKSSPSLKSSSQRSTAHAFVADHGRGTGVLDDHGTSVEALRGESSSVTLPKGKKIMFVIPKTAEFGGLEKHLFGFLRGLDKSTYQTLIVCFGHPTISEFMDEDLRAKTVVKCVPEPESLADWFRFIRQNRPDIIVFCYSWFKAFPWQGPLAALLAGVRRRISIQHLVPLPPPPPVEGKSAMDRLRRLIGRRRRYMFKVNLTGRLSHATICVSDAVRNSLVRDYQFPERKTMTIHNGISTSAFVPCKRVGDEVRSRFDVSEEDFLLVCAARLSEAKGVDIVLHAVSRVLRQGVSCKCLILGDGPLKEKLQKEANSLGLTDYVYFEGFQKDVRPYLQACSAFILTSHIEGLPLSILEAMACGLPCIVTDVGGNVEAVKDGVTGLVISPGSLDEAENAILYLATHPRERAQMAARSRETACRSFDIESKFDELKAVIVH